MATLFARPTHAWPVLGLQGQLLGNVERCALDATTGELKYLELRTAWQKIDIEWVKLEFDEQSQSFKLNQKVSGTAR
jgi:hypothetical protein